MPIQLIDKIKQKNNGKFFLLDSVDIDYAGDGLKNLKEVIDAKADKIEDDQAYTAADKAKVDGAIQSSEKGVANGVATLDENGFIPSSQIPGGYDDIYPAANKEAFPPSGDVNILYYALDSGVLYRWVIEEEESGNYVPLPAGGGTADKAVADSDGNQFQSTYLKKTDAEAAYVKKEDGKGLSANDYTNEEKQKLAGLSQAASVFVANIPINADADVALSSFVVPSGIVPKVGDVIIDQFGDRVTIASVSGDTVHTSSVKYAGYHPATTEALGAVKIGSGLSVDGEGTVSVNTESILSKEEAGSTYLPLAGGTMTGAISFTGGSISGTEYTGNAASATKATQDAAGNVISDTYATKQELTASAYKLPAATTSTMGGVIVGDGLSVSDGTVSISLDSKMMGEEDIENLLTTVFGAVETV